MKFKRIIAREGLIIISIAVLFAILLIANERVKNDKYEYEMTSEIVEIVDVTYPKKKITSGNVVLEVRNPTGIYVMMQKPTDLIRMQEALKKDFPKINNPTFIVRDNQSRQVTIQRYYNQTGDVKKIVNYDKLVFVVIFIYPVYLLIRFIYWSVKTLLQNER